MNEGWFDEQYVVLLSAEEASVATERYGIAEVLPGYSVLGLLGWDDFILRAPSGDACFAPTVPLDPSQLAPYQIPSTTLLKPDPRFIGRVKWYVTPVVFGGSTSAKDNVAWVTHQQHTELVVWWNAKYRELKAQSAGA